MFSISALAVPQVRSALLQAGSNLWQPLGMNAKTFSEALAGGQGGGDAEVNQALEQLLGAGEQKKVGRKLQVLRTSTPGRSSLLGLQAPGH